MLIDKWGLVAADLRSEYGFDVYDQAQRRACRWAAARSMIGGLMSADTRLARWYDQQYGKKPKSSKGR
jgi:hypothetical protein